MKKIELKGLDEVILHDVCDNGLNIYMYVNKKVKNFYATLNIRYGAIDTEFSVNKKKYKVPSGIAHFLEHLKFNQPNGITAHEYYSKLGSSINAFTSYDITAYEVIAANNFNENIEYLLDYVQTPYFTKDALKKEKGIIIEEIKMYDDNPGFNLYDTMKRSLLHKDNRRFKLSGTIEDVKKTTVEDINLIFDTFYHPMNMFIVITGNFNPEETVALIKENQSRKKFGKYKNPIKIYEKEPIKVVNEYTEIFHNVESPKVKISFKMAKSNFKNISDLNLRLYLNLFMKITFGETSHLKEELLSNSLINGGIITNAKVRKSYVILSILTETNYPNEIINRFKDAMNNIKITTNDLERKKRAAIASTVLNYDDIEAVNYDLENDLITYNEVITDIIDRLKALNIKDAEKLISNIKLNNYSVVVLYPKK